MNDGRLDFQPAKAVRPTSAQRQELEEAAAKLLESSVGREEALRQARQGIDELSGAEMYLSSTYQVAIRRFGDIARHISVKRIDRDPIFCRDDLVQIGMHFTPKGGAPVELYPAESRVVDSANQYHIFVVPNPLGELDLNALATAAVATGNAKGEGFKASRVQTGTDRDWREVMKLKAALLDAEGEAVDLLLPETLGIGPCLFCMLEPGFRFPFGFAEGIRHDAAVSTTKQRPGA